MLDINQALMRRGKPPTPVKQKRVPSSQKKVTATMGKSTSPATAVLRFSRLTDEANDRLSPTTHATSPSAARATTSSFQSPQAPAPTRQSYIDLGQKDFGRHVTCPKCGLLYTAGEEEDEKEHRRFCRDMQRGITVPKWKNERVLKSFPDDNARIIEIRADDAPLHVKKLLEVKALLDDALGFVEEDVFLKRGHFLFVQGKQIVGSVTVERISTAMALDESVEAASASDPAPPAVPDPVAAVLGICQLWVHPQHRGKRIATRLVDVVREKYIYGMHIAKHRVAFSQPTRNGLAFAKSYVSPHRVLVYGDDEVAPTTRSPSTRRAGPSAKRVLLP